MISIPQQSAQMQRTIDVERFRELKRGELYTTGLVRATEDALFKLPPFSVNLQSMQSVLNGLRLRLVEQFENESRFGFTFRPMPNASQGRLSAMAQQLEREHTLLTTDLDDILSQASRLEGLSAISVAEGVMRISDAFTCFHRRLQRHEYRENQLILETETKFTTGCSGELSTSGTSQRFETT